jgi:hypothetical protein
MIDGDNVLIGRHERISDLFKFFSNMPKGICARMIQEVNGLWTASYDSLKFLEGFTYTQGSRRIWRVLRDNSPNQSGFTGVLGTEGLGLNVHQENWIYINRIMDDEEVLDIIEIKGMNDRRAEAVRGRIIGAGGKARRILEIFTGCSVSVYGRTISLIGNPEQVQFGRRAIEMLISGATHKYVYKFLERGPWQKK